MSAYISAGVAFKKHHAALLVACLAEMGYVAEYHENGDNLYGYQGDKRKQIANVIVRRKHVGSASNDIGWEFKEDGTCVAHISQYDQGVFDKTKQNMVAQKYAEGVATQAAKAAGYKVERKVVDGKVKLTMKKTAWG